MEASRHPLKDISTNSPSVKRHKPANPPREGDVERHAKPSATQQQQTQQARQAGLPLTEWQRKWRAIMKSTVVYFDLSNAQEFSNKEREVATRLFNGAGATLAPFFDNNVTIVITLRKREELPKNMASNSVIKVWDYDKVFRFFSNLGEKLPQDRGYAHLSTMWQDEKLHGVADRDPSAKRDDIHYFKYPFFHVFDLRDIAKPVSAREWKNKEVWPQLYQSTAGHSLFQEDPSDMFDDRKVRRRKYREQQLAPFRRKLRHVYEEFSTGFTEDDESEDSTMHNDNTTTTTNDNDMTTTACAETTSQKTREEVDNEMPPPMPAFIRAPTLSRQGSALHNKFIEATKRGDPVEMQASGYNGSVSAQSAEFQTRNGLAPTVSTAASKQLNSLQRKTVKKVATQVNNSRKDKVSGYCENCKTHFDDFDGHIVSLKHREFATNPENFEDIDDLIRDLNEHIRNKY